jgi:hypothetical protein
VPSLPRLAADSHHSVFRPSSPRWGRPSRLVAEGVLLGASWLDEVGERPYLFVGQAHTLVKHKVPPELADLPAFQSRPLCSLRTISW